MGLNLKDYSAMAATYLLITTQGEGQIVYTDINPDLILEFNNDISTVDVDNNGTNDFAFFKTSEGYYHYWVTSSSTPTYRFLHKLWAGPLAINNEIAARSVTHGSYGGSTVSFPYKFENSEIINSSVTFQNGGFQVLGSGFYQGPVGSSSWHYHLGYWQFEVDSGYLGVKFFGDDLCMHYGWIRCSVQDSTKKIILHDYAYETKCETGIFAGDTIGDTSTVGITNLDLFTPTIYSYSKSICINIDKQLLGAEFSVVNLEGKLVYSAFLGELNNKFSSVVGNGTYIVTIIKNSYSYSKQIILVQ